MLAYSYKLKEATIFQNMYHKGNCYDNWLLRQKMYCGITYYSFEELKEAIEKYIVYYNKNRIKEKLSWMSPIEYRLPTLPT